MRGGKGACDVFGDAFSIVNALYPLSHATCGWAKKAEVIDFLKGFAVAGVAGDIAHKQHHGRGILKSGVHANGSVGCAWSAGDKADARTTGEFARCFCHERCAAFLPVDHKFDVIFVGMKTV